MIKHLNSEPSNDTMDNFALQHGHAFALRSPDYSEWVIVSDTSEIEEYKKQGWRHRWTVNKSDILETLV